MKTIKIRLNQKVWQELIFENLNDLIKPEVTRSVMDVILREIHKGNKFVTINFNEPKP